MYPDWDEATALAVGGLREVSADDPDDPRLLELVSELSSRSERFKQLWQEAEVGYRKGINHMRHPDVGDLYLTRTKLDIPYSAGRHVLTFHAPPDSVSMRALTNYAHRCHQIRCSAAENDTHRGPRPPWQAFRWRRITHSSDLDALSLRRLHGRC